MAKQKLNRRPDAFPPDVNWNKVRKSIDADNGALQKHENSISKLEKLANRNSK